MASTTTPIPGFALKQQPRRPLSRIVPAIPHRLARAPPSTARPLTPEASSKGTVARVEPPPQPDAQAPVQKPLGGHSGSPAAVADDIPLTPDSRISGADKSDTDAPALAHSPPTSQDDHGEDGADAQAVPVHDQSYHALGQASATRAESKPLVNGVRRKLAIPAQLPPPFYPSNSTDIVDAPAEGVDISQAPFHRHQFSAGAVIFQSANGSPVTPAALHDPQQDIHQQQKSTSHPPPGLAPRQWAQFMPTHSQHPSDAEADVPWVHPQNVVVPLEHVHENGTGTSHSQSPSRIQLGEQKPGSDHGEGHLVPHYQNGSTLPTDRLEESPFELAAYLSTQFANPEFADFILQIRSPESALLSVPVHGIVVVRSPIIAEAVRRSPAPTHRSRDARRLIDIMSLDPFVTRESLEEAVKVLYGAPLLSVQTFLYGLGPYSYESSLPSSSDEARRRMQQVLSYIAAAKTLQIPSMQARGVEIARVLLRWDTVDQVLRYGFQVYGARREAVEVKDLFIDTLLNYAIDFIAYTFPVDFKLYAIAPEFQDVPRLPVLLEPRLPTHNPRLSKIRFGDAPPGDDIPSTHVDKVLSTILLSLPPHLLERLINHPAMANQVGWSGAVKLMSDVIAERENRRRKALRGHLKPAQDGLVPASLLNNMYTEEQLEPSHLHPSGYKMITKRTEI